MKKFLKFCVLLLISTGLNAQNVGINATGAAPDAGSLLDISSTNKGLLIPRVSITNLTTIAPITGSATTSMLVYNTNAGTGLGYHYWDGNDWTPLGGGDWKITGNAGTVAGTNFLGTTDAVDFSIRRQNIEKMRILGSTTSFMDEIQTRDGGANSGDILVRIYDNSDDGIIDIYENNAMNHRIHANGNTIFNNQGLSIDFRIETPSKPNMFQVDASENQVIINRATHHSGYTDPFSAYVTDNTSVPFAVNGWNQGNSGGGATFSNTQAANAYNTVETTTAGTGTAIWGFHDATAGAGIAIEGTTNAPGTAWAGFFNGDVGCTGTYFGSDKRWKKNIQNLADQHQVLDKVMELRPTQYNWDADNFPGMAFDSERTSYGFIAQELDLVFPDLVTTNKFIKDPTKKTSPRVATKSVQGYYMVDYIGMIPVLTQAIQEQQFIIEGQNEKIERLEKIVEQLQGNK
jgi:hypothetical protein